MLALKSKFQENSYGRWSKEDDQKLLDMFALQIPRKLIALTFDRSYGAIASRLRFLGVVGRNKDVVR